MVSSLSSQCHICKPRSMKPHLHLLTALRIAGWKSVKSGPKLQIGMSPPGDIFASHKLFGFDHHICPQL